MPLIEYINKFYLIPGRYIMLLALEAFCLMAKRWLYLVVRQKEESPVVNFSLTHEAIPMLEQHQDSLLPRVTQGEEGHETAEKRPDLVFINRVLHIVNIHVSDPESFV